MYNPFSPGKFREPKLFTSGVRTGLPITPSWVASRQDAHVEIWERRAPCWQFSPLTKTNRRHSSFWPRIRQWPCNSVAHPKDEVSIMVHPKDEASCFWSHKNSYSFLGWASSKCPTGFCCTLTLGCPFLHHRWPSETLAGVNFITSSHCEGRLQRKERGKEKEREKNNPPSPA